MEGMEAWYAHVLPTHRWLLATGYSYRLFGEVPCLVGMDLVTSNVNRNFVTNSIVSILTVSNRNSVLYTFFPTQSTSQKPSEGAPVQPMLSHGLSGNIAGWSRPSA